MATARKLTHDKNGKRWKKYKSQTFYGKRGVLKTDDKTMP